MSNRRICNIKLFVKDVKKFFSYNYQMAFTFFTGKNLILYTPPLGTAGFTNAKFLTYIADHL